MVRALRIPADQNEPITELQVTSLKEYQSAVGGWIEAVDIVALGVTVYVHEERLLFNLPFNSRATFLWWYFTPTARQTAMLVGPALVVGLPTRTGHNTDNPSEAVDLLTRIGTWRVEVRMVGDPIWHRSQASYDDFWEALVLALVMLERWTTAEDVRVVAVHADELSGGAEPAAPA